MVRKYRSYQLAQQRPYRSAIKKSTVINYRTQSLAMFEGLAKAVGALAILLYVMGLLAVNGYLFQLNVTDFSLVRARFIYTGALLAVFSVLPYVLALLILNQTRHLWDEAFPKQALSHKDKLLRVESWRIVVSTGMIAFMLILLFCWAISIFSGEKGVKGIVTVAPPTVGILASSIGLGVFFQTTFVEGLRREKGSRDAVRQIGLYGLTALTIIAGIGIYTGIFMGVMYPRIPEQFGGGQPTAIQLLVKHEVADGVRATGVPIPQSGDLSSTVELLYNGSDSYVLRVPGKKIVQIDKDAVLALTTKP